MTRYLKGLVVGVLATGTGLLLSLVISLPMPMRAWVLLCLAGTIPADLVILRMVRVL